MRAIALLLALLPGIALAAEPQSFHRVEIVRWKDADTLVGHVQLFGDLWRHDVDLRADFDAWETSKSRQSEPFRSFTEEQWSQEHAKGHKAFDAIQTHMKGKTLYVSPDGNTHGIFGRTVTRWYAWDGAKLTPLKAWMAERGHLRNDK